MWLQDLIWNWGQEIYFRAKANVLNANEYNNFKTNE